MAKKQAEDKQFEVLAGFDCAAGRWEIGDPLRESDLSPEDVAALIEMGAISEVQE